MMSRMSMMSMMSMPDPGNLDRCRIRATLTAVSVPVTSGI